MWDSDGDGDGDGDCDNDSDSDKAPFHVHYISTTSASIVLNSLFRCIFKLELFVLLEL